MTGINEIAVKKLMNVLPLCYLVITLSTPWSLSSIAKRMSNLLWMLKQAPLSWNYLLATGTIFQCNDRQVAHGGLEPNWRTNAFQLCRICYSKWHMNVSCHHRKYQASILKTPGKWYILVIASQLQKYSLFHCIGHAGICGVEWCYIHGSPHRSLLFLMPIWVTSNISNMEDLVIFAYFFYFQWI